MWIYGIDELRFADDKTKQVIDYYTASVIENEDYSIFMIMQSVY